MAIAVCGYLTGEVTGEGEVKMAARSGQLPGHGDRIGAGNDPGTPEG